TVCKNKFSDEIPDPLVLKHSKEIAKRGLIWVINFYLCDKTLVRGSTSALSEELKSALSNADVIALFYDISEPRIADFDTAKIITLINKVNKSPKFIIVGLQSDLPKEDRQTSKDSMK